MADFTPYSTAVPYFNVLPQWASAEDQARVASYSFYEELYWGHPETLVASKKGSDEDPIHIPAGRSIVDAIHRYLAVDWNFSVEGGATPEEQSVARGAFLRLFRRESMWSKFATQKRYGLIRGDAIWHITADPNKEAGSRISIYELDPASFFPIYDINDLDRVVGCHIIEFVLDNQKQVIRRQTYRKEVDADGQFTGLITSELALFELSGWDDRVYGTVPADIKLVAQIEPPTPLPTEIKQLPIYHWKNVRNPADPFGSSALRGIERLLASIDQTISDQDLAVALNGLGLYATDSAGPVDEDGNDVNWIISPGRVVELTPGTSFARVNGITTVQPSLDHANYIEQKAREGLGVPGIAVGDVDVKTAESGIALAIRMSPMLSGNKEKELEILGVTDQMLFDLQTMWFPAYEQITFGPTIVVTSTIGEPIPQNRASTIQEIIALSTCVPPIISLEMAQAELAKLGYEFPAGSVDALIAQQARLAEANDPYSARVSAELAASSPTGTAGGGSAGDE